jgi:hypothetical protein
MKYIGQTGLNYWHDLRKICNLLANKNNSKFSQHLQGSGHHNGMIENVMQILHVNEKRYYMCKVGKFYIYKETINDNC